MNPTHNHATDDEWNPVPTGEVILIAGGLALAAVALIAAIAAVFA